MKPEVCRYRRQQVIFVPDGFYSHLFDEHRVDSFKAGIYSRNNGCALSLGILARTVKRSMPAGILDISIPMPAAICEAFAGQLGLSQKLNSAERFGKALRSSRHAPAGRFSSTNRERLPEILDISSREPHMPEYRLPRDRRRTSLLAAPASINRRALSSRSFLIAWGIESEIRTAGFRY